MDISKHQTHRIIHILTPPLVRPPMLKGAASGVTTDLRFYRPFWARTTGLKVADGDAVGAQH
eukprot:897247-Pleurochrysis_carterae.AAC.1